SQVLRNLISNALKFTERGEVRVSARYDAQRRRMTFVVTDTGIGIAPENRERIFEEFSQVEGALQKRSAGTGLGLSVSRRLAELLGGEVWLDSELGRGSQFYLTVPVVYAGLSQAQTAALEPSQRRTRVLVIDDDETFRYVLRQFLSESREYEMIEAGDGREGLRRIYEDEPEVVILDLQMPNTDGFEVLQRLSEDPSTAHQRLIV